ncbi:MAG: FAD-dependent oxidoreductase, partial [Proteobacteria bacterium]|nr:FAD-dependent oxidoreductase [Pseudomonadota bacterium]
IQASKATEFAAAVSRYFPAISADKLIPAYSGIRPKLTAAGEPAADFVIQKGEDFAMPGLIQLFGIESPGLTASLAIGEYVLSLLSEVEN